MITEQASVGAKYRLRSRRESPRTAATDIIGLDCTAVLAPAVGRLRTQLERASESWMMPRAEIDAALTLIAQDVALACGGRPRVAEPPVNPDLHFRLGSALRTELLRTAQGAAPAAEPTNPAALLAVLWELDRYLDLLWPEGPESLQARLAEPDAFHLLLEVGHDIRSPLNSILFLSEVMRSSQSGPITPLQQTQLGLIYGAAMGLLSVVSDVMELAQDPGSMGDEPVPFSIGRIFDWVHQTVRPIAEEKKISLEFSLPAHGHCVGRPGALGRVLLNLATNALKFTDEGGVTIRARRIDGMRVEFSVRDTGHGIAPDQMCRLFEHFRRSGGRKGQFFAPAGLGLSIARRLLRSMGSELFVQSELGNGSVFRFTLDLPPV